MDSKIKHKIPNKNSLKLGMIIIIRKRNIAKYINKIAFGTPAFVLRHTAGNFKINNSIKILYG